MSATGQTRAFPDPCWLPTAVAQSVPARASVAYKFRHSGVGPMHVFRKLFLSTLPFALLSSPAFAGVTVSSPGNGAQVSSPFTLSADAATCSSQPVAAMGYSFDSSASTAIINADSINQSVPSATGQHTLHVKAWGNQGASCVTDVALDIEQNALHAALSLPIQALSVSSIQALTNWMGTNDSAGSGHSNGRSSVVGSPPSSATPASSSRISGTPAPSASMPPSATTPPPPTSSTTRLSISITRRRKSPTSNSTSTRSRPMARL